MKILAKDKDARTGLFKTNHGIVKTPFFMPVATKMGVKFMTPRNLKETKTQAIIANSFIMHWIPGVNIIKKHGGIHEMMKFNKTIFTDSGGFQKIRDSLYIESNDKGVVFKSPFDGKNHLISPKKAIKTEYDIGSDVAMVIDDMPLHGNIKKEVETATERTHKWAKECLEYHKKINKKKQLLFGIAQGGTFKNLREKSAKYISSLNFDGVAFGGLAIGETTQKTREMINLSVKHFPEEKVRYLMGVGNPRQMIEAISAGADCFDSTFPTQNARHGTLFTSKGKLKILNSRYKTDIKPIDKDCDCYVCKNFSRSLIRHFLKTKEPNGSHFATYHNVYFMNKLMHDAREAIKKGNFEKFKKEFLKKFK